MNRGLRSGFVAAVLCCALAPWAWADSAVGCEVASLRSAAHHPSSSVQIWVVLSPRMPYALREWPRMASVARRAGFELAVFRDPRVPLAEWQAAVQDLNRDDGRDVPALDMHLAQTCQLLNHAPAAVLSRCGNVHAWPVWGVMPDAAWLHVLNARRVDLERMPCA